MLVQFFSSAIWQSSGLIVSDIVTHYLCILFELFCTLFTVNLLARISKPLTELCEEMGSILLYSVTLDQVQSVTSRSRWKHLGWFFFSVIVFPFSFYIVYARWHFWLLFHDDHFKCVHHHYMFSIILPNFFFDNTFFAIKLGHFIANVLILSVTNTQA